MSYALIALPFSYLGYVIEIPVFIMGILFLGFKRGMIVAVIALLLDADNFRLTGIHNTAPIIYNQTGFPRCAWQ